MNVAICGSMSFAREMLVIRDRLIQAGHQVVIPFDAEEFATHPDRLEEKWQKKDEHNLIRQYYHEIEKSNAILVLNMTKNNIANYVGGNAFLEMGFAHVLNKTIYLYNPVPEISYRDEIIAMQPVVLGGNLSLLYEKS